MGEGVAASKLAVVPLAFEAPAAARTFSRAYPQRFNAERPMRVLFLGQINLRKGVEALFDAIRLVGDAPIEFWFVGPLQVEVPPDLRNSSRIRWFGPAARSGTDEFYRDADVFVLPSFSDGFGLTQLEARAWHLPVLASRFCGDVVEDGRNGVLLPEVSGAAIAAVLDRWVRTPGILRGAGRVCERTARRTAFDAGQAYVATHRTSRTGASAGTHGMTSAPAPAMARNAPGIDRAYVRQVVRARSYRTVSTVIIVAGAAAAFALVSTLDDVNTIFSAAASVFGVALAAALAIEARGGVRNVIRTDLLMLLALYALTFLEFLFPQASFGDEVTVGGAITGTAAVLVGFVGLAIGRHFVRHTLPSATLGSAVQFGPRQMMAAFVLAFVLGYFYIFLAVNFDLFEAIRQMQWPRFSQSWTRGRLGGWHDLLNEVGALIYLLPPLGGAIFAQRKRYGAGSLLFVAAVLALTFFMGFTGGTRNVLLTYLITFVVAYLSARSEIDLEACGADRGAGDRPERACRILYGGGANVRSGRL